MTQFSAQGGSWNGDGGDGPPVGSKRAKLKGYLKAANEIRQSVQQQYSAGWGTRGGEEFQDGIPGAYPDTAIVTSGHEQMLLFPSYARKHIPKKRQDPRQDLAGQGGAYGDISAANESEFMRPQWEEYIDKNAIVDVDVRGWIFSPHKGQMTRRQRVFVSLARQLAGLPAPTQSPPAASPSGSREASPHTTHRQRVEERAQRHDEEEASRKAAEIVKKGETEAEAAGRGQYTEAPSDPLRSGGGDNRPPLGSNLTSEAGNLRRLAHSNAAGTGVGDEERRPTPVQRRSTWAQPADMSPEELASANAHLMARLAPFMSNPSADIPISAFFYNDDNSRQRTIYTNSNGHFALRASLDFVPTHVRILASETLSATEEVIVTPAKGISLISDVDDTIKHSAISSGAREIFRNAFIRELGDLNIEGVQEWYSRLAQMDVKFHYVSNSPWQLYPVLKKYFQMTGLPPGSFHLKQYSGMLQGIFEPVAERKKGTLDRIATDFPERRFILVGDSGEADLEVYLDFVADNPGRVLAIFIRDVTTPQTNGFFDSSMGSMAGPRSGSSTPGRVGSINASAVSALASDDDPELKAAIAASLKTLEAEEEMRSRPTLPPRRPTDPGTMKSNKSAAETEDLIDLSDDPPAPAPTASMAQRSLSNFNIPPSTRKPSATNGSSKPGPPSIPRKPLTLQSKTTSPPASEETPGKKAPPPPPTRRSTAASTSSTTSKPSTPAPSSTKPSSVRQPSPARSIASSLAPSTTSTNYSYRESARQKLVSAYNSLPAAPWNSAYVHTELNRTPSYPATISSTSSRGGPPVPPQRGGIPSTGTISPTARVSNAWQNYNDPGRTSGPEQSVAGRTYSSDAYASSSVYRSGAGVSQPINKRLELWTQRWERAREYCKEKGVVLKSWRVGGDIEDECVRIIERARREEEGDSGRKLDEEEWRRGRGR